MSKAKELRAEAYAKLQEVHALVGEDGSVAPENEERWQALLGEFKDLDAAAGKAATTEDEVGRISERMSWYNESATGKPMHFQELSTTSPANAGKSPGQIFVESPQYQSLVKSGAIESDNSRFRSDRVDVSGGMPRMGAAASDILQTESGSNVNQLVQPYRPGIFLPLRQMPTVVRDLFPNENMPSGDTIEYAAQTGFDNAAAAVAQATSPADGAKPQSSFAWEERTSKATWIATWMAATRQALSDISQLRSLIDNQGRLMIKLEEDDQLLNGNGTPPNLRGILNVSGIQTLDLTGEDNLDGMRTTRRLVKTGVSRLDADFVVLNPVDSEEFDLLKDGNGQYRGGNPIGNFTFNQPIWSLRRVESEGITAGTALVGAGVGATVFERQGLSILVADQHSDFFIRNLIVILFEERLAFPVYFPTAFVEVTLGAFPA